MMRQANRGQVFLLGISLGVLFTALVAGTQAVLLFAVIVDGTLAVITTLVILVQERRQRQEEIAEQVRYLAGPRS